MLHRQTARYASDNLNHPVESVTPPDSLHKFLQKKCIGLLQTIYIDIYYLNSEKLSSKLFNYQFLLF